MAFFGFGGSKKPVDRYAGKPFLKLVESFVLKCIGALPPEQERLLEQMTSKLNSLYGVPGSWEEVIIAQLHFPPTIRDSIRDLWKKNQLIAVQNNVVLAPQQFAEMFVDNNVVGA